MARLPPVLLAVFLAQPCLSDVKQIYAPRNLVNCFMRVSRAETDKLEWSAEKQRHCTQLYLHRTSKERWSGWGAEVNSSWTRGLLLAAASSLLDGDRHARKYSRKEYRVMTDAERRSFHEAVNSLKNDTSVKPNKYEALALLHAGPKAVNAHGGASFLIWHRLFLMMLEKALQEKSPDVTVPFWDVTMDSRLEDPRKSNIWSNGFLGNGDGIVTSGPFANWTTAEGPLIRNFGKFVSLPTKADIDLVLTRRHYGNISVNYDRYFLEGYHNNMHVWVGGLMTQLLTAPMDPTFYLVHCFIDYVWWLFHERQRTLGVDPTKDYPTNFGDEIYSPNSSIGLEPISVMEALRKSIDYTDSVYTYHHRYGMNCRSSSDCGSPYLRCANENCVPRPIGETGCPTGAGSIQNNYCVNDVCDIDRWAFLPVQIAYVRPKSGKVYYSYRISNGHANTSADIYSAGQYEKLRSVLGLYDGGRSKCEKKRESCCSGVGPVFLETNGLNYQGVFRETAIVDQRYAISSVMAYVAVKRPGPGKPTRVLISATDSCGRVCKLSSKNFFHFTYSSVGLLEITADLPKHHGDTLGDAYMKVWEFQWNELFPRYQPEKAALTFYCVSRNFWPFTGWRK